MVVYLCIQLKIIREIARRYKILAHDCLNTERHSAIFIRALAPPSATHQLPLVCQILFPTHPFPTSLKFTVLARHTCDVWTST